MSYQGFGKRSGPSAPPQSKPTFGSNPFSRPPSSSPSTPPGTATFLVPPPTQPLRPRYYFASISQFIEKRQVFEIICSYLGD